MPLAVTYMALNRLMCEGGVRKNELRLELYERKTAMHSTVWTQEVLTTSLMLLYVLTYV
jgi:hypothetical protein